MKNEVIFDSRGIPDIMVSFTPDELGLPAELRGRKVESYLIGKYLATMIDGVPYSLPYQKPTVNFNRDEAIRFCERKGSGWHLLTNDEWAALAHSSWENDTMPTGNTASGKSHSHPEQTGTTYTGSYGKTLTGSGPVTWNHDGTAEGVADMCGNVWEHVGGIRFLNGQVQVIPDNGAAAGTDQSADSKEWEAIYTADGDPIYFNPRGGKIFVEPTEAEEKDTTKVRFMDLEAKGLDVPDKLIKLGLYPPTGYESEEYFWINNNAECYGYRGGHWTSGANAGVFSLGGDIPRSYSGPLLGFRSALVRYSGDTGNLSDEATDLSEAPQEVKDEIKANAEKLESRDSGRHEVDAALPSLVRIVLSHQLAVLYEAAGGEDPYGFKLKAYEASDKELQQAAALSMTLAQVNAGVDMYRQIGQQLRLATTTTITMGKEVGGHE